MMNLKLLALTVYPIVATSGDSSWLNPLNVGKTILLSIVAAIGVWRLVEGGMALSDCIHKNDRTGFADAARTIAAGGVMIAISAIVGLMTA